MARFAVLPIMIDHCNRQRSYWYLTDESNSEPCRVAERKALQGRVGHTHFVLRCSFFGPFQVREEIHD